MPYTCLIFATRKPTITPSQFKDYWENIHVPLLKSLTGDLFPLRYKRQYLARVERKGFGGPANPDHPPLVLRGSPSDFDFDAIGEMTWEDEKTFQRFHKAIYETDVAAQLAKDEEYFLDAGGLKIVVIAWRCFGHGECCFHDRHSSGQSIMNEVNKGSRAVLGESFQGSPSGNQAQACV
ncbi:hypothetical protein P280DRAFT_496162 [Massarina eburnea CBS 473.64]|uniref:EthD domain-containing protein n=1 Tax=Massarina eburnea CBS 473.64 TaxID=1395130 RepID=A0A6A6SB43_9PLEO|nr:hypothetical protein P280DRAFT_496162 [Massarina eburnea CBS 473.64]